MWSEYGDRTWVWTPAGKPSLFSASRRHQPPRGTRSASTGSMLTASCLLSKPAHSVRPSTDAVRGSTRSSQRRWPAATPSCSSAESSGSAAVAARLSSPPTACPMSREERAVRRDRGLCGDKRGGVAQRWQRRAERVEQSRDGACQMRNSAGAQPTGATEPSCCSLLSSASRPDEAAPCSRKVRGSGRRSAWGGAPPLLGRVSEPSRRCLGGAEAASRRCRGSV